MPLDSRNSIDRNSSMVIPLLANQVLSRLGRDSRQAHMEQDGRF